MKQSVRYNFLTISGKLRGDLRITIDSERNPEYNSTNDGNSSTVISFYPTISLSMIRPTEIDENGQRIKAMLNPNDYLGMTKFNLPIFMDNLNGIIDDMKTHRELYTYHGKRLELNEEIANRIRRPFPIGNVTVELSAVIIINGDDERLEGVKLKFNNEQSAVYLTLNELTSLADNLKRLDIDTIAMLLYLNWISRPDKPKSFSNGSLKPIVDIMPKQLQDDFI